MKLKPGFDDELQPKKQPWFRSIRSIGQLMLVVAVGGLTVAVVAGIANQKRSRRYLRGPVVQRPVQVPQVKALVARKRDSFVVIAAADIDAKMVMPAPAEIDEAMVINPDRRDRQADVSVPGPASPYPPLGTAKK
jgi:hypothetical protein